MVRIWVNQLMGIHLHSPPRRRSWDLGIGGLHRLPVVLPKDPIEPGARWTADGNEVWWTECQIWSNFLCSVQLLPTSNWKKWKCISELISNYALKGASKNWAPRNWLLSPWTIAVSQISGRLFSQVISAVGIFRKPHAATIKQWPACKPLCNSPGMVGLYGGFTLDGVSKIHPCRSHDHIFRHTQVSTSRKVPPASKCRSRSSCTWSRSA